MPPVPAALDALIARFPTSKVAGRRDRAARYRQEVRQKLERRGYAQSCRDASFQDGQKPILVFSDAGGTGRSYHADLGCRTADKRRVHFLLEPGWRADVAIQGLGRQAPNQPERTPGIPPGDHQLKGNGASSPPSPAASTASAP
jgi:hypothetical protein